ncbi:unnamed protein product [Darwinula stevensoni]|uniref:Septin-type G domain-containing protein n=1 Tax=Darwinula stevensoni TaxID=69355 RepID=A0A7R9A2N4_9CRUS|nr:unnamed protein product [Darwinula stevensoni]CAG0886037.1 unnamed protein product [Darwinula stevensoni]
MKKSCYTKDGYIYQLQARQMKSDLQNRVQKQEIGHTIPGEGVGKVLMLVGATGAGKSTLIHGMVNYAYGVKWNDDFRFKLTGEDDRIVKSEVHSQTNWISAYVLTKQKGMAFPYTLTVIDTPGFGNTEGIKKDDEVKNLILEFFSHDGHFGIDQLHGIGFVVPASGVRLTPMQAYIFDCVMSVFGNDVKEIIFLLATFADNTAPPVLNAVKEAKMPCRQMFKFNNSALFVNSKDIETKEFDHAYWKMGTKSFSDFFKSFQETEPVSLTLTKEVLRERRQLQVAFQDLKLQLDAALERLDTLRDVHAAVRQHGGQQFQANASDLSSETSETEADDEDDEARGRYLHTNPKISANDKRLLKRLAKDFNREMEKVHQLTKIYHERLYRLDQIALKPDPLGVSELVDKLIQEERFEKRLGFNQRIQYLQEAQTKADFVNFLQEFDPSKPYEEIDMTDFDQAHRNIESPNALIQKLQSLYGRGNVP